MKSWKHGLLTAFGCAMLLWSFPALAADATAFNPLTVSVEAQAISGVPVGTIITWPVVSNPEGWADGMWLECNGQTISPTVYPELFALVGGRVPDLRGLFLRGTGGNAGALGQVQGDAIRNITGSITTNSPGAFVAFGGATVMSGSGALTATRTAHGSSPGFGGDPCYNIGFNASLAVPTASENRPVNRSVRYLIRAR